MINDSTLCGWIGHELKLKNTISGEPVVNFDMSTTESYFDSTENKWKTVTDWHKVVAYGKIAENIVKFFNTGMLIYLKGKSKSGRRWTDKQGVVHEVTEVVVKEYKNFYPALKNKSVKDGNENDQNA